MMSHSSVHTHVRRLGGLGLGYGGQAWAWQGLGYSGSLGGGGVACGGGVARFLWTSSSLVSCEPRVGSFSGGKRKQLAQCSVRGGALTQHTTLANSTATGATPLGGGHRSFASQAMMATVRRGRTAQHPSATEPIVSTYRRRNNRKVDSTFVLGTAPTIPVNKDGMPLWRRSKRRQRWKQGIKDGKGRKLTDVQIANLPPALRREYWQDHEVNLWTVQPYTETGTGKERIRAIETDSTVKLPGSVFDHPPRSDVMHLCVRATLAGRRGPNRDGISHHVTKRKKDIAYSGRKIHPQKGTGRARHGDKKAPQFKGGAKAHGPVKRDHSFKVNKKQRRLGLMHALSSKAREGRLIVFENLEDLGPEGKTVMMRKLLDRLFLDQLQESRVSVVICDEGPDVEPPPPPPEPQFFAMREGALPTGPWVPPRSGKRDKLPNRVIEYAKAAGWQPTPLVDEKGSKIRQGERAHDLVHRAGRNIKYVEVCPRAMLGVWWVLRRDYLLVDRRSLDGLVSFCTEHKGYR